MKIGDKVIIVNSGRSEYLSTGVVINIYKLGSKNIICKVKLGYNNSIDFYFEDQLEILK